MPSVSPLARKGIEKMPNAKKPQSQKPSSRRLVTKSVVAGEEKLTDSTRQKKTETSLQDSETHFRVFMESTQAATFVFQDSRVLYVNPATEALFGYSVEELLALNFWALIHPDFRQAVRDCGIVSTRDEKRLARQEIKILTKSGRERWIDFSSGTLMLEGKPAVVGSAFDITARKQSEEEMQRSQELFQSFMNSSPACAYIKNESGQYIYTSKSTEQNFPKLLGKTDAEYFSPAVARAMKENDLAALSAVGVSKFDEVTDGGVGARQWTSFKFPVVFSSGKKFLAGFCLEVTQQKKLEEQLRESEERYRTISEITSDYAYAFRIQPGGTFSLEWITAAFSRISGLTSEEVTARRGWVELCHPDDVEFVQRHREAVLSGQEQTCEFRIIAKSGEVRWLRNSMRPVWDREEGRVIRIYGAGQDITDRKRLEEQLRERVIQPKDLGSNLRRFRQQLGLTQAVFGQAFGGYSQRQITSYETGEIEIPMGLLLSIRKKGYPLEVVLGESQTDALDKIVGYLSASWKIHETAKRLTESILHLLDRESETISSIMNRLGIVVEDDVARDSYPLRDMLRRAGIEPSLEGDGAEETVIREEKANRSVRSS